LRQEFAAFQDIPLEEATWPRRKGTVRNLEQRVEAGDIALTSRQLEECRHSELTLGRILAYLLVRHHQTASDLESRGADVRDEWLRIQAEQPSAPVSRMPLHYALEAYLAWLKRNRNSLSDAAGDAALFRQIDDGLGRRPDRDRQPKSLIEEIQALIAPRTESAAVSPTVTGARYALAGVVIAALLGTVGTVIANWDKLFAPKPSPAAAPAQSASGAQSPNISGARDVTIQYGPATQEPVFNVAGKWRTETFTDAYDKTATTRLTFDFAQQGGTLSGTVTEADADGRNASTHVILDGRIQGKAVSFYTQGEVSAGDDARPYKESYSGIANQSNNEIAFTRIDDLPSGGLPEKFVARRR
jgi:hypothetical protein